MGKTLLLKLLLASSLALSLFAGCKSDDTTAGSGTDAGGAGTGSHPTAGSGTDAGGAGTGGNPPDDINGACPTDVGPLEGEFAPKGKCCYRTANSTRVDAQGDKPDVEVEYRLNYVQTANHPLTIGGEVVTAITQKRSENEEQSVLWRFKGPRKNGDAASGPGEIELGAGRYNCDGTYSFYSSTVAPATKNTSDAGRWKSSIVPINIDATIKEADRAQERVVPDFEKNENRGYTYTPYVDSLFKLDWELVNQGFTIDSFPTDKSGLNCIGSRKDDGSGWTGGGTFIVYTPLAPNDSEPIAALMGQTYCQLVAFGAGVNKDSDKNSCSKTPRCTPNTKGCTWLKLPDSLCPETAADQKNWGCHVGDENNPDKEPTKCTATAPTGPLNPQKGATTLGQCCDPLGKSTTLPPCNAYFLRQEYVAAAAEITDEEADVLQEDCHTK